MQLLQMQNMYILTKELRDSEAPSHTDLKMKISFTTVRGLKIMIGNENVVQILFFYKKCFHKWDHVVTLG